MDGGIQILHTSTGMPFIPLSTQGEFYLTCVRLSDAPEMARIMSIPQIYTRLQNPPYPYTLANAESWIKSQTNPIHKSTIELPFAALRANNPESGPYIGSCSLRPRSPSNISVNENERTFVLGYYLDPAYHGYGIMAAAVNALIAYAFSVVTPSTMAVFVEIADDNPASKSVIDKVGGFEYFGEEMIEWPEYRGGGMKRLILFKRGRSD